MKEMEFSEALGLIQKQAHIFRAFAIVEAPLQAATRAQRVEGELTAKIEGLVVEAQRLVDNNTRARAGTEELVAAADTKLRVDHEAATLEAKNVADVTNTTLAAAVEVGKAQIDAAKVELKDLTAQINVKRAEIVTVTAAHTASRDEYDAFLTKVGAKPESHTQKGPTG